MNELKDQPFKDFSDGIMSKSLLESKQLPVSSSQLQIIKVQSERRLTEAESLVCTAESLPSVKAIRAEVHKEYDTLDNWRKTIKTWAMKEYKRFETDYKNASKGYADALSLYSKEIQEIEAAIKQDCENGLREYFAELRAVHHLDWLTYEQTGIKVDMASAKAKTPKKLMDRLASFVARVAESVDRINTLEDAGEIMVEYQKKLDAAGAICTVKERHRRIEEQKKFQEARDAIRVQETEAVRRVEALAPPVVVEAPEPVVKCTFTVRTTKSQLRKLKEFLNMEGIKYEQHHSGPAPGLFCADFHSELSEAHQQHHQGP